MRFKNKVAMVVGSGGIGAAVIEKMVNEGARVVIVDMDEDASRKIANSVDPSGENTFVQKCDITNKEEVDNMVNKSIEKYGSIDILINGAGITRDGMFHKMTADNWEKVINVNLSGVFYVTRQVVSYMREQNYGKIVSISSTSAHGNIGQANYSASKAGLIGFTKTLAKELGRYNINVNAVSPGPTETEMLATVPEKVLQGFIDETPLGRLGKPEEQADAICYLASDEASYITGVELLVCGGATIE